MEETVREAPQSSTFRRMVESEAQSLTGVEETLRQDILLSEQRYQQGLEEARRALEEKMEERDRARSAKQQELEERVCRLEECVKLAMGKLDVALMRLEGRTPPAPCRSPPATSSSSSSTKSTLCPAENLPLEAVPSAAPRDLYKDACGEVLMIAAKSGKVDEVKKLLHEGVDVNFRDNSKQTPLHVASRNSHEDVVSLLLEEGADVNAVAASGITALHYAALTDSTGLCVSLLLSSGADVNIQDYDKNTPLHWAAINDNAAAAQTLIAAGADKTINNKYGQMPHERTSKPFLSQFMQP